MLSCDCKDKADGEQASAAEHLVLLLHMSIDLVEDSKIARNDLKSELLDSLNDSLRSAIDWRRNEKNASR